MLSLTALNKKPIQNRNYIISIFAWLIIVPLLVYLFFTLAYAGWNPIQALTNILQNDLIILVTILVCTITIFLILYLPPNKINVEVNDDYFVIDNNKYLFTNAISWAMVDLGSLYEVVIKLQGMRNNFQYLYVDKTDPQIQALLLRLGEILPYNEILLEEDRFHIFFRSLGLR